MNLQIQNYNIGEPALESFERKIVQRTLLSFYGIKNKYLYDFRRNPEIKEQTDYVESSKVKTESCHKTWVENMWNESPKGLKMFHKVDEVCFKIKETNLQIRPLRIKDIEFKYDEDPSKNFVCSFTQFILTNGENSLE